MIKNCLAAVGLVFLAVLAVVGVLLAAAFFDLTGTVTLPEELGNLLSTPLVLPHLGQRTATISVIGTPQFEVSNPLEEQPLPTWAPTETPIPTPTPIPPLAPEIYRTEVLIRMRHFATALEDWLAANDRLAEDHSLMDDPAWREEMGLLLDNVANTGQALTAVGPPPPEYQEIDSWLDKAGEESLALRANFLRALESSDPQDFTAAGDSFTRIREYLALAAEGMIQAGWPLE